MAIECYCCFVILTKKFFHLCFRITVQMDDDMVKHYSHEDTVLLEVHQIDAETHDITLVEYDTCWLFDSVDRYILLVLTNIQIDKFDHSISQTNINTTTTNQKIANWSIVNRKYRINSIQSIIVWSYHLFSLKTNYFINLTKQNNINI